MPPLIAQAQDLVPAGWKDILRPIRDGLRDRFPGRPEPPPDLEKRRKQQAQDALKGFAYLEDFDELQSWGADKVDPIQRSNVPLLQRAHTEEYEGRSRVLLCHDFAGNYHDYESSHEQVVFPESYSCEYLQFVDAFVYFSHKLVAIPPPTWTNTLHRNGVKSLGTILVEPQTLEIERLLTRKNGPDDGKPIFVFAEKLAEMARTYGFDGWLLNLEKAFPAKDWDSFLLLAFIEQLREELGPTGQLVWYDALTVDNKVDYQNSLTKKNWSFARAAGSILINYSWTEQGLEASKLIASENQIPLPNIYWGIDVWAQNKQNGPHRRNTYPTKDGGGTNTGVAVAKLAQEGFSAGIFGPAWSFEHFPSHGRAVERAVWEGMKLPICLECSCGVPAPHDTAHYLTHPILKSAYEYPAGSETFFSTNFRRAFWQCESSSECSEKPNADHSDNDLHCQLGSQDPLPILGQRECTMSPSPEARFLHGELGSARERHLNILIFTEGLEKSTIYTDSLRLFKLDMKADGSLHCYVNYEVDKSVERDYIKPSLYLRYSHGLVLEDLRAPPGWGATKHIDIRCPCGSTGPDERLLEVGLAVTIKRPCPNPPVCKFRLQKLVVYPRSYEVPKGVVESLRIESHDVYGKKRYRLKWEWSAPAFKDDSMGLANSDNVQCSNITGPFYNFALNVDGLIRLVYAAETVLDDQVVERMRKQPQTLARIFGYDCVGNEIARYQQEIGLEEADWEIV